MKTIKLENISKKYVHKEVLKDINYTFEEGKCYMIIGSNGSGKSTLIKIILDLVKPDSGKVEMRNYSIGYVPEKYYLAEFLSIETFLMMMGRLRCREENKLKERMEYLLTFWEILGARHKKIKELSKGMMQKVVLIQAMLTNPDVYILDEALNGLDSAMQTKLINFLDKEKEKGKIIIITSHYPKLYQKMVDIVIEIKNGKLEKSEFI